MSAHTAGPWSVVHIEGESPKITAISPRGLERAVAYLGGFFSKSRMADACLIGAAPDLLDQLRIARQELRFKNLTEDGSQMVNTAIARALVDIDAAISKATEAQS